MNRKTLLNEYLTSKKEYGENKQMNLNTITNEIRAWAIDRGLEMANPNK